MVDKSPIISAMKLIVRERAMADPLNDEYDGIDETTFKKFLSASQHNPAFIKDFLNFSAIAAKRTINNPLIRASDIGNKMKEIFNRHNIGNLTDRGAKSMCGYAITCGLFVANRNKTYKAEERW